MTDADKLIPTARFEPKDIGDRFIWSAAALSLGVLMALALLVYWMYPSSTLDRTLTLPLPVYPAPRLQPNPAAELQAFHAKEMQRLNSTGWIDKPHGVAHISIRDAMREVAQDGIQDWPSPAPSPPQSPP